MRRYGTREEDLVSTVVLFPDVFVRSRGIGACLVTTYYYHIAHLGQMIYMMYPHYSSVI